MMSSRLVVQYLKEKPKRAWSRNQIYVVELDPFWDQKVIDIGEYEWKRARLVCRECHDSHGFSHTSLPVSIVGVT